MIRFVRPAAPAAFGRGIQKPRPKGPFDAKVWRTHKGAFSRSQHGKCGYCETYVAGTQDGDVEHYAPKGGVHDVAAAGRGIEAEPGLPRLKRGSRKTIRRCNTGYWWRAYEWNNFLFACSVCNGKYKRMVFPLDPVPPVRWKPMAGDAAHRPLLLNCFDDDQPWRHFQYTPDSGEISGTTLRGTATIDTCGLHRETLRIDRRRATRDALGLCNEIIAAELRGRVHGRDWWVALRERGGDERPFAGAVRAVAEARLGLRWAEIVAVAGAL